MTETLPEYEVFAIRYATREARRPEHFIGGDPHDVPMPIDYFTWVIKGAGRSVLVDTGFTAEMAAKRKRIHLRCPIETMRILGVEPEAVEDVVLTHLHYDHVGSFHKLPNARFHLQDAELAFATGRYMRYPFFNHSFEVDEVIGIVRLNYKARLELHSGDVQLAPGITLHKASGHTAGLQIVRVHTKRGWIVLASDASHFYENMQRNHPFTVGFNLGDMVDSYRIIERLAPSPRHIIPGHDPLVMRQYPAPEPSMEGIVIRLDVEPREVAPAR